MNTRRSTFVRILFSALALIAGPVALAGDVDPSVQEIAQGVAYGSVTSGTGGAQSAASDQGPIGYDQFRMAQQRDRVIFAILLSITALIAQFVVLRSLKPSDKSATHVVSATGLIYIVFGTTILVVIANSEAQLTASMGILGAVAGYVFGRIRRDDGQEGEKNSAQS
jgi:hypothetical protein